MKIDYSKNKKQFSSILKGFMALCFLSKKLDRAISSQGENEEIKQTELIKLFTEIDKGEERRNEMIKKHKERIAKIKELTK